MISDAMANAALPAFSKDSSAKKKKASRCAKLKQNKLDVRREQWLSQVKRKNDKVGSVGVAVSPISSTVVAIRKREMQENPKRTMGDEHEVPNIHDCESESIMSSSIGSSLGHDCFGKDSIGNNSSSSSSTSGSCSGSVSEEERDGGCLDDWEAIADALSLDGNQGTQLEPGNDTSNNYDPANSSAKICTPVEVSKVAPWSDVSKRAWRPDDASRPKDLPNPSKQHEITSRFGSHMFNGEAMWSWRSIASQSSSCPICCEDLDLTDSSFLPCPCGFRLCLFCHKRILEDDGRCPGCRRHYETMDGDASFSAGAPKRDATYASVVKLRF